MAIERSKSGKFRKLDKPPSQYSVCQNCKRDFFQGDYHAKRQKYCSKKCAYAVRRGKPTHNKGKHLPDAQKYWTATRRRMLADLWEYTPKAEIQRAFPGKTWYSIKNQLRYMKTDGLVAPVRKKSTIWRYESTICRRYLEGMNSHDLAKRYGTSHPSVLLILKKNKIQRRSKSEAQKLVWTPEKRKRKSEWMFKYLQTHPEHIGVVKKALERFYKENPGYRSKKMKAWIANPDNYAIFCRAMKLKSNTPEARERLRIQRVLQKFPLYDAKTTEVPVQNELKRRKIPFSPHYPIYSLSKKPIRLVDIAFPNEKVVVECDGDYWHGNPAKFKNLNEMQVKRQRVDTEQDRKIREVGWVILRFWESDIHKDVKACVDKIEEALKNRAFSRR